MPTPMPTVAAEVAKVLYLSKYAARIPKLGEYTRPDPVPGNCEQSAKVQSDVPYGPSRDEASYSPNRALKIILR